MTVKYDPRNRGHRETLAWGLTQTLYAKGFREVRLPKTNELVFEFPHRTVPRMKVRVYTSAVRTRGGSSLEARGVGSDAVRVIVVYTKNNGEERGVFKERRINRAGSSVESIVERTVRRAREAYADIPKREHRCPKCGAPKAKSKQRKDRRTGKVVGGNMYCAELCWKK